MADTAHAYEMANLNTRGNFCRPPKPAGGSRQGRVRRALLNLMPAFSKRRLYFALSMVALIMLILNIAQITNLEAHHENPWIIGAPATVFTLGVLFILMWAIIGISVRGRSLARTNARPIRTPYWWARTFAIASVILTILAPFAITQFWYMDVVALKQFNQTEWVTSVETRQQFTVPTLTMATIYLSDGDPMVSMDLLEYGLEELFESAIRFSPNTTCYELICVQKWTTSFNDTSYTFGSDDSLTWSANVTVGNPEAFRGYTDFYGFLALSVTLSDGQYDALNCRGTPGNLGFFPWATSTYGVVAFDLQQVNDDLAKPDANCPSSYSDYRTTTVIPNGNASGCADGCILGLRIAPRSGLVTTLTSQRRTDANKIIVDEAGVLGAVAFFAWFFGIYVIGIDDEVNEQQEPVGEDSPPPDASDEDDVDAP